MSQQADIRRSPVARRLSASAPHAAVRLIDRSLLPRWGMKGRNARSFASAAGAVVPETNNSAARQADGALIARLAPGELLILADLASKGSDLAAAIRKLPPGGNDGCYPVPRNDSHFWFVLAGPQAPAVMVKLCAIDFSPGVFKEGAVAQTMMMHTSVIVVRSDEAGALSFAILADSASAEFLWDTIIDAMAEFQTG